PRATRPRGVRLAARRLRSNRFVGVTVRTSLRPRVWRKLRRVRESRGLDVAVADDSCAYGCAYRVVSDQLSSLHLLADTNRPSCRMFQLAATRYLLPGWTFNPKVAGSNPARPIVILPAILIFALSQGMTCVPHFLGHGWDTLLPRCGQVSRFPATF